MFATLVLDPTLVIAPVTRRLFGSFVEHLGRCVYTGIFEPGHATADEDGFRTDVLALTRELGVSVVRYPGGNFVSGYRWEDGVGPLQQRPRRRDLAWHSIETNQVGINEFARWATKADVELMYAVNLGTRGIQEALDVHEYVNHPEGTFLSELRRAHGANEPHGIRMWCLGNEMDGPWQTGQKTAEEYGRLAGATARALRAAQPDIELVACGSSGSSMPTFIAWEATVLEAAYDAIDFVSCHAYYEELDGDVGSFLASSVDLDHVVHSVVSTADNVGAKLRNRKRLMLSFDEWNVWYLSRFQAMPSPDCWAVAPSLIEDEYTVTDAVVVGSLLIALLRHSDRVTAACLAQLVNVIAPIRTEPNGTAWRQTTFHPFATTSRLARGNVLSADVHAPKYETARYGHVPALDAVATHDPDSGELTVFAVNRDQHQTAELTVDLRAFDLPHEPAEAWTLADHDRHAANTAAEPNRVTLRRMNGLVVGRDTLTAALPPISWTAMRLRPVRTT